VHIPPGGRKSFQEAVSPDGIRALLGLVPLYFLVAAFWSLFDQPGSSWVLQAEKLNRNFFGYDVLAEEIQTVNPVLILIFIPLFSYVIYPLAEKFFRVTPLRKIGTGMFIAALSFVVIALIEVDITRIQAEAARSGVELTLAEMPHAWWQVLANAILTAAEVLVSITCLEFSYTQAPPRMKSFVMALYMLSVSAGNLFTSLVNHFMIRDDGTSRLEGAAYFWFFAGLMAATAVVFVIFSTFYRGRTYMQDDAAATAP
jgi:POT family proton-dependent oligopeptide transporter